MKRLVSGIQPTGKITLGNYIGAIRNFVKLREEMTDYEFFIFVADLHAITIPKEKDELRKSIKDLVALYLACGLNLENTNIFIQSEVYSHSELGYLLQCYTYIGELERMTQFKDKSQKQEKGITSALLTYPVLMAADILLYDPDFVPVGEDQKQHLEITRDIAIRFNNRYGDSFTVPEGITPKIGARIMSLAEPTKKMSKSDPNPKGYICLLDDLNVIRNKIKAAVTDPLGGIYYDQENKPGISNLLTIYSALTNLSIEEITLKYQGLGYKEFKEDLAEIVVQAIEPIQRKYKELVNSKELDEILDKGRDRALMVSTRKVEKIKNKIGLGRKK